MSTVTLKNVKDLSTGQLKAAVARCGKVGSDNFGPVLYEATLAARELCRRQDWIDAECGGDIDRAAANLEGLGFCITHGLCTLYSMFEILDEFQTLESWAAHKFDLALLLGKARGIKAEREKAAAERGEEKEPTSRWSCTRAQWDELVRAKLEAEARLKMTEERLREAEKENATLRSQMDQLKAQVTELTAKLDEVRTSSARLESMLGRRLVGV